MQNYKELGLLFGHLGTIPVNSAKANSAPAGEKGGTGTYFPRAKHSSLAVAPLAVETVSGNCTSILGSYSPITPVNRKKGLSLGDPWTSSARVLPFTLCLVACTSRPFV